MSRMFNHVSARSVQATAKLASFIVSGPSNGPVRCASREAAPSSADPDFGSVTGVTTHSHSVASGCDWSGHSDVDPRSGGVLPRKSN